jgi:hypothetical protein
MIPTYPGVPSELASPSVRFLPIANTPQPRVKEAAAVAGPADAFSGRCMCGNVSYTVAAAPATPVIVCHCRDSQRQTGSAYTIVVGIPAVRLTVSGEALASYATVSDDHHQQTIRSYCSAGGSPIVTHDASEGVAFIKVGTLDDPSWATPRVEMWRSSAPPWAPRFLGTQVFKRDLTEL